MLELHLSVGLPLQPLVLFAKENSIIPIWRLSPTSVFVFGFPLRDLGITQQAVLRVIPTVTKTSSA